MHRITYSRKKSLWCDFVVEGCKCCEPWPAIVGSEGASFSGATKVAQIKGNDAIAANVGPEGKSKRRLVCFEHASAEQNVGLAGNGNGECNDDGLGNGISNSNGISFPDENVPRLVASTTHVNNRLSEKVLPELCDHDCLIATFDELEKMFPCQLQ